jgi:hypothetical protein
VVGLPTFDGGDRLQELRTAVKPSSRSAGNGRGGISESGGPGHGSAQDCVCLRLGGVSDVGLGEMLLKALGGSHWLSGPPCGFLWVPPALAVALFALNLFCNPF